MSLLKGLLVGLLLLIPLSVHAQPDDWHVVTYEWERGDALDKGGIVDVIGPDGVILRHRLPAEILPPDASTTPQIAISDNLSYAAVAYGVDDLTSAPPLSIYNLDYATCCVTVKPPLANAQNYTILGFNADSTLLAFSYAAFPDPNNRVLDGGLVIVSAKTGALVATLDLKQMQAATGQTQTSYIQPLDWTTDGSIRFVPGCWMCEGVVENSLFDWNPATGAVTKVEGSMFSIFGDTLPATGELLYTVDNTAYPSGQQPGYIPPANVVEYYADGIPDDSDTGKQTSAPNATIVYHDPHNLNLPKALWVADGRAFVLQGNADDPTGTLVFRDGTQIGAGFGDSDRFLAALPDGWLALDAANNLNHYVVGDGTVKMQYLDDLPARAYTVWSPKIGQDNLPPFKAASSG